MEIKYIKENKNEVEVEINNLTVAEVLRAYLVKDSAVLFAAWKREHPSKNPVLKVNTKGKTAKKAIADAASQIEKEADALVSRLKKDK